MTWNLEAVHTLRWMLAVGASLAEVAARLGTTRGAVAGKAARLRAEQGKEVERVVIKLPPKGWVPA